MKLLVIALMSAVGVAASGLAQAADDGAALAEKAGCMKCHAVGEKKKGPALKEAAKDLKGKSVDDVVKAMKENKGHKKLTASDDDLKALAKWVQSL